LNKTQYTVGRGVAIDFVGHIKKGAIPPISITSHNFALQFLRTRVMDCDDRSPVQEKLMSTADQAPLQATLTDGSWALHLGGEPLNEALILSAF
jgi:hypothetical protein